MSCKKEYDPIARREAYLKIKDNPEFKRKMKESGKKWRTNNREKVNKRNKNWRDKNKEKIKKCRINQYNKIKTIPLLNIQEKIRKSIKNTFKRGNKNYRKNNKTIKILGCSIDFFLNYILSKCPKGTTIQDFHKFGYHLDHIVPISSASCDKEVEKLNHYTNFQPLWWKDNLSKSNKILI